MLMVRNLTAAYGRCTVLRGVNFVAEEASITAILGPAGGGKTTLANAVCGILPVAAGEVIFAGADVTHIPLKDRVRRGISYVPSGLRLFSELTAVENLQLAAIASPHSFDEDIGFVLSVFPQLKLDLNRLVSKLSVSVQRTIMLARAVISRPRLLVLDQPSFGLKGQELHNLFNTIAMLNREQGTTVLLLEQRTFHALKLAETAFFLENGRIAGKYRALELLANRSMQADFLGGARLPVETAP